MKKPLQLAPVGPMSYALFSIPASTISSFFLWVTEIVCTNDYRREFINSINRLNQIKLNLFSHV